MISHISILPLLSLFILSLPVTLIAEKKKANKIGVLLVNHGSRSATWRTALLELEEKVKPALIANPDVKGVKTAFMEYNEPSIATRMKEFDDEGFTDVVIVPVFLTVSAHTFDDIPTIIGIKEDPRSLEALKLEKIARYRAKARAYITPNLDFTDIVKKNVEKRVKNLSKNPNDEGVVLIAYGDANYDAEWSQLMEDIGSHLKTTLGITNHSYGWCGHLVSYNPEKTAEAIRKVHTHRSTALVVPVLVAHDEMFQIKIIGDGIAKAKRPGKSIVYKPDSILPDENVEKWVVTVSNEFVRGIRQSAELASQ